MPALRACGTALACRPSAGVCPQYGAEMARPRSTHHDGDLRERRGGGGAEHRCSDVVSGPAGEQKGSLPDQQLTRHRRLGKKGQTGSGRGSRCVLMHARQEFQRFEAVSPTIWLRAQSATNRISLQCASTGSKIPKNAR